MNNINNSDYTKFLENEPNINNNGSTHKNTLNTEKYLLNLSSLKSIGKDYFEILYEFGKKYKFNSFYQKSENKKHLTVSNLMRKQSKIKTEKKMKNKRKRKRQLSFENTIFFIYFLLNYNPKKPNIQMPYQLHFLKNLCLPDYNIFSKNYNLSTIFYNFYMDKFIKKLSTFFHKENQANLFYDKFCDFLSNSCIGYKTSLFEFVNFINSWTFKIIINNIWDIFCIYSNGFFVKIFCFDHIPSKSNFCKYINYLNIEIKLNIDEEKVYAYICNINFLKNNINKIRKAIDIYELIKGIIINKNIIFIKEKEILYDIFIFLKIIKFPLYKRIKTVKIVIFEHEQFRLMNEYLNYRDYMYGNKSTFYEEVESFDMKYYCISKKDTENYMSNNNYY